MVLHRLGPPFYISVLTTCKLALAKSTFWLSLQVRRSLQGKLQAALHCSLFQIDESCLVVHKVYVQQRELGPDQSLSKHLEHLWRRRFAAPLIEQEPSQLF